MNIANLSKFKVLVTLSLLSVLSLVSISFLSTARSSAQERKYTVKTFKDMPVEVHEVRNLQSENWFRDLEIEVKNISDKPIYFIALAIEFPDIPAGPPPTDRPYSRSATGFNLKYGRPELGDVKMLATSEDIAIKPGETYVFTIPEGRVLGLENMTRRMNLPPEATNNIAFRFLTISFGDGTGFEGSGPGGKRITETSLNDKRDYPSTGLPSQNSQEQLFRK